LYYRDRTDSFLPLTRWLLALARFTAVTFIAFLLLAPLVRMLRTSKEKPLIVMAMDNSLSVIQGEDSSALTAAWESLAQELADDYDVRPLLFGDQVNPGLQADFSEKYTDASQLMEEIRTRFTNRNLGAVVLATDGLFNRGRNPAHDPGAGQWPVVGVALGDTSAQKDVRISRLFYNRITYLGNEFPMEVVVQASGYAGETLMLQVLQDGRGIRQVPVRVPTPDFSTTLQLVFPADKPGITTLNFSLVPRPGEENRQNNVQTAYIEVLDARQKVLIYAAAPHPDLSALRQAIEGNQNYEVEVRMAPAEVDDLDGFNLLMLHGLPSVKYPGRELLDQVSREAFPTLFLLSQSTDLRLFNALDAGVEFNAIRNGWNEAQPLAQERFGLFTIPHNLRDLTREWPPLRVPFADINLTRSAFPLFNQKLGSVSTDYPLVVFSQDQQRKSGVVLGEGIWRWRMQEYLLRGSHVTFDLMVNKMVQYLSVRADRSRFRVMAEYEYPENIAVNIGAELYNEAFELVNEPDARMVITDAGGKSFPFAFTRKGMAYTLDAGVLPPGPYSYNASVQLGEEAFQRSGKFTVTPVVAEMINTRADHSSLYRLAGLSGGEVFARQEMAEVAEWIRQKENIRTVVYEKKTYAELIHLKWVFFALLALLTLEWFIRRWLGSY